MTTSPLLFREPVVTRERATLGYDFTLYSVHGERAPVGGIAALLDGGSTAQESLFDRLQGRFVFADCGQVELERSPGPPGRFVLALRGGEGMDDVAGVIGSWKGAGFGLCLELNAPEQWPAPVLAQATHLRVDSQSPELSAKLGTLPGKKIAGRVRDQAGFQRALSAGFDLCQGYFFTEPAGCAAHAVDASYTNIVNLMKLAQDDAPIGRLEELLKRDAALSFKLLRYINSAGFGLSCEIQSFRHAVTVLGYRNLHKWLALLLVTAARQNSAPALVTTAVARGRLAELLGQDLFDAQDRDNLFLTGTFSLLHAILQMPLEKIADQVALPDSVTEALFNRAGPFGPLLDLILTTEALDTPGAAQRAADLAMSLGLTHEVLNRAQVEAIAWAEGLTH
jgi:c-di-GMP phosphodiesterase